jgi:hypothetical protein
VLKPASFNGVTYSQTNGGGELREQLTQIEAEIEELADRIERGRKIILLAKAAAIAGGVLLLGGIVGVIRFDPAIMIGAITAVIAGIVVFGSNTSTLDQTAKSMKVAKARRAQLIVDLGAYGGRSVTQLNLQRAD